MSRNIRIRTTPNGGDNMVKVQLNQDFDFLEILSLKISQEDVYRSFYSDYGIVVGRVIMNSGVGVPNARVSVFIPLTDEDAQDPEISTIYPYNDLQVLNQDGVRYNTLPKDAQGECHAPIGTFPTKREIVDNPQLLDIFQKYYKYTTTTNGAGDFMLFGVPVGNHILNIDVDLSDIGIFSQRPYDFIEQGNPSKLFESPTKFKKGNNLNNLTQVKNRQVGVNVIPFWGDVQNNEIGISRVDVDVNYNIQPNSIFIGNLFGDNEKNSINKTCRPRRKLGRVCEMAEGSGTIEMIRKNSIGEIEEFQIEGGQLIDDTGSWAYQIPMNLDYMVTNEFGVLVPSDDPNKGIPTRTRMRFKIYKNDTGGEGRLRTTAKYLIPHNPSTVAEVDYNFDESTADANFRDLYWNKIYTVTNHITRFQRNSNEENRNFLGFKDVDNCVGVKNPLPFNKLDTDFNPLYFILCIIISIIINIIAAINRIIKARLRPLGRICRILGLSCIGITCDGDRYTPGCSGRCRDSGVSNNVGTTLDCFKIQLALALNVFEFDFYNDWLNGSLYAFLLKYKKTRKVEKFCGDGEGDGNNFIVDTNIPGDKVDSNRNSEMNEGVIVKYKDELFYKPINNKQQKFYATEIYNLGSVFNCDWQGLPKIQESLIPTTYQIPPLIDSEEVTGIIPLLFNLTCVEVEANQPQSDSIKRICELGVGLDEDDDPTDGIDTTDGEINTDDIDNALVRARLIQLNVPEYLNTPVSEIGEGIGFDQSFYVDYRNVNLVDSISQFERSFFFYFGTIPNNSALDLMNSKYFTDCSRIEKPIIQIIGVVSDVTTVGGSDGTIDITVNGGTPEYTYSWFNVNTPNEVIPGGDEPDVSGLEQGTYFVIVTDLNGFTVRKTFVVGGLQALSVNISTRPTRSAGESTGAIFINSITGGIGPYDVVITGPSTNETFNDVPYAVSLEGLPDDTYTVTVSDNSTTDDVITIVEIGVPTPLQVTITANNPNCLEFFDGSISVLIEGGTPDYSIVLTNVTSPEFSGTVSGSFVSFQNDEDDTNNNEIGGTIVYSDLEDGTYELKVIDEYQQQFPGGNAVETITLTDTPRPVLIRDQNIPAAFRVSEIIEGVEYEVFRGDDETPIQTFIGEFDFLQNYQTITGLPFNGEDYVVISEFGCQSNIVE